MSLVAYGSSGESDSEEDVTIPKTTNYGQNVNRNLEKLNPSVNAKKTEEKTQPDKFGSGNCISDDDNDSEEISVNLDSIPKPKLSEKKSMDIAEEDDDITLFKKVNYSTIEKPPQKPKGPVKITIPSLSQFKDIDDEDKNGTVAKSRKGSGLLNALPPPSKSVVGKTTTMVPYSLTKKVPPKQTVQSIKISSIPEKSVQKPSVQKVPFKMDTYDSSSEEEEDNFESKADFFSLSAPPVIDEIHTLNDDIEVHSTKNISNQENKQHSDEIEEQPLTSTVMNLSRNEIILKNKTAEVGPKLPLPEQEYRFDSEGNVAFDDKAIEYLCGRRGVKRKNDLSNVEIMEISGEDIKPDERDWLVKALTEEPVQSSGVYGAGPSGTSKRKHQITYLAHQAKAMEIELKNQWAQNKFSRQQTRSKYGF